MNLTAHFNKSWNDATALWDNPNIDEPDIFIDKKKADQAVGRDQIAFITLQDNKIKVHYPNLVSIFGADKLTFTEEHEIGHYKYCPETLRNNLSLIIEADKIVRNLEKASYIENIYTDILDNTRILEKNDPSGIAVYKKQKTTGSKFWNIYMRTCERLWSLPKNTLACNTTEKMESDAKKLEDILRDSKKDFNNWRPGMRKFTKIVKDYIKDEHKKNCSNKKKGSSSSKSSGGGSGSKLPNRGLIDDHKPKDFLPFDIKKKQKGDNKKVEKELKGLAKEVGPSEYRRAVSGFGLGTSKNAVKWFYRDLASGFEILFRPTEAQGSTEYPISYQEWNTTDEVSKLDIIATLQQYGMVVPEVTTLKKVYEKGEFGQRSRNSPDLLLVLDSSGSMPDPSSYLSIPVLSAMVAARSAVNVNKRVSVINFSDKYTAVDWTRKLDDIEDIITEYHGNGTNIPGAKVLDQATKNENEFQILIITDTQIHNLDSQLKYLSQATGKSKRKGIIFLANQNAGQSSKLKKARYNVVKVTDMANLWNLTLEKTKELYGE